MRRFILIAAGVAAAFCLTTSSAQAYYYCPLPYWYPLSWTVMTRQRCLVEYPATFYYPVAEAPYRYDHVRPYRRVSGYHRTYLVSRRPYLRPGWWW